MPIAKVDKTSFFVYSGEVSPVTQSISLRILSAPALFLAGLVTATTVSATVIHYGPGDSRTAWREEKQNYSDLSVTPNIKGVGGAGRFPIGTTIINNNGDIRLDWANRTYAEPCSALHQTPLHQIRGNLTANNDKFNDVDLFEIWIEDPSTFKAWTVQTANNTRVVNPQLFLFDGDGHGIYASDNAFAGSGLHITQSIIDAQFVDALTGSDLFGNLTSGLYLLGISRYDIYPRYKNPSGGNRRIFDPNNRFHMLVRPQADANSDGIADHAVSSWVGSVPDVYLPDNTPYRINLEGAYFAAVPTPGVIVLFGVGLYAMGMIRRR